MKKILFILFNILLSSSVVADHYPVFTYTLDDAIVESVATQKDVLLIFTAEWCVYCGMMKKDLDNNLDSLNGLVVSYVNIDEYPELAKQYKVKQIPEAIIIRNTKEIKRKTGYKNFKTFQKWLNDVK